MKMSTLGKILGITGAAAACAAAAAVYMTAPGKADEKKKEEFKDRNIAHRGLHSDKDEIPENSLAAFEAAAERGYGIELDIRATADARIVVFHDEETERLCGVQGNINDMTWSEVKKLRLKNTDHGIPLLSEALGVIGGRSPVIIELKRGPLNAELCERTLDMIRCYNGAVCIESFDPMIVGWFRRNAPEVLRGQLTCSSSDLKGEVSPLAGFLLSRGLTNFIARPHFIAHKIGKKSILIKLAEKLGAMRVAWTAKNAAAELGNDVVIFEGYRPRVKFR